MPDLSRAGGRSRHSVSTTPIQGRATVACTLWGDDHVDQTNTKHRKNANGAVQERGGHLDVNPSLSTSPSQAPGRDRSTQTRSVWQGQMQFFRSRSVAHLHVAVGGVTTIAGSDANVADVCVGRNVYADRIY